MLAIYASSKSDMGNWSKKNPTELLNKELRISGRQTPGVSVAILKDYFPMFTLVLY